MSSVLLPTPPAGAIDSDVDSDGSPPRRWTCAEFHKVGDKGLFEGENLILIDGEILEMPAAGGPHDVGP